MVHPFAFETVWFDHFRYHEAERDFYERIAQKTSTDSGDGSNSSVLVGEIARAREQIKHSLNAPGSGVIDSELANKVEKLVIDNEQLKRTVEDLSALVKKMDVRITALEKS
ncbi:elongation factor 1-delta-like [Tubulanus polymorphus]|uniref:elongation factor 1-delta-like n=1 Tax=Tubulanus polymorphus TaxID=672921 RepID=UPI003DA4CE64